MVSNDSKGAASFENDPAIVEKIRSAFDMAINNGSEGWERDMIIRECQLVKATATPVGRANFEITCAPHHGNRLGNKKKIFAQQSKILKKIQSFMKFVGAGPYKLHVAYNIALVHGGCTATLFDSTTTAALIAISRPGFWVSSGVSRTLNVTYLRPITQGTTVIIETEVVHAGKRLGTIKGTMLRKSDGVVLAICEHGKVNIDADLGFEVKL